MEKMRMESVDMTEKNIEKIESLFPNCITEALDENGKLKKAINFEVLKQMLSNEIIDGDEAYEFTWVGKKSAIVEANKPTRKTLRPCIEESVDWNNTKNLYIEGDNLEVLKLLQESYLGSINLIYIDPPYNTGNDFIYRDNFNIEKQDYYEDIGMFDDSGNRLFRNSYSNGRFHSDWCSMIYPRLMLARNLLSKDGVIFISIDDHELENLKNICDEIFGLENYQATISYVRKTSGKQDSSNFMKSTEYILVYSKTNEWKCKTLIADSNVTNRYNKQDLNGRKYRETDLRKTGAGDRREDRPQMWYPFYYNEEENILKVSDREDSALKKQGYIEIWPIKSDGSKGRWRWGFSTSKNNIELLVARIMPKYKDEKKYTVYEMDFIDKNGEVRTIKEHTCWDRKEFNSDNAMQEFKNLGFSNQLFPFPKSSSLMKHIVYLANIKNGIVLDFFSGSGSMAQGVMRLNAEDGENRKFIMVQLPESCTESSDAIKFGYNTICDIGKERIRRAGEIIKSENNILNNNLDVGFRVFKVDDSNMNNVYYSPSEYSQDILSILQSNIKDDRSDLDLLFGCLLEWGLPLSLPYNSEKIDGCTVHNYNNGDLVACFNENIPDSVIKHIAKKQPLRAVFRDGSFASSPAKINVGELFKSLAPDTRVKVI